MQLIRLLSSVVVAWSVEDEGDVLLQAKSVNFKEHDEDHMTEAQKEELQANAGKGNCKPWCRKNEIETWTNKCMHNACSSCSECATPGGPTADIDCAAREEAYCKGEEPSHECCTFFVYTCDEYLVEDEDGIKVDKYLQRRQQQRAFERNDNRCSTVDETGKCPYNTHATDHGLNCPCHWDRVTVKLKNTGNPEQKVWISFDENDEAFPMHDKQRRATMGTSFSAKGQERTLTFPWPEQDWFYTISAEKAGSLEVTSVHPALGADVNIERPRFPKQYISHWPCEERTRLVFVDPEGENLDVYKIGLWR